MVGSCHMTSTPKVTLLQVVRKKISKKRLLFGIGVCNKEQLLGVEEQKRLQ